MTQPGGLLALDLATVLGFAYAPLPPGPPPTPIEAAAGRAMPKPYSGHHRVAAPGASIGRFLLNYDRWLVDMIATLGPTRVIFEAPLPTNRTRKTNFETVRKLICIAGLTEKVALEKGVGIVREANHATVKKHFTGHGRADKAETIAACRALGWDVDEENEADALALWSFAVSCWAPRRRAA